jgi:asparagine synthase (glutamine-hydrolysing)
MYMTEEKIASRMEATIWHSEAPVPDVNGMGKLALSEVAHSKGLKVVMTGLSYSCSTAR